MAEHEESLRATQGGRASRRDQRVEEASLESFPASDPPAYTPSRSGDVDREVHVDPAVEGAADIPEKHTEIREWAARFGASLSGKGTELLADLIAPDVVWRAGDGPLLVGRDAVMQWHRRHVDDWGRITHRLIDVRGDDTALFIESEVSRGGGGVAPNHEAMSIRLRNGMAVRVQLYGSVYDA